MNKAVTLEEAEKAIRVPRGQGAPGEPAPTPRALGYDAEDMNAEYAFVLVGSKAVILRERRDAPIEERVRLLSIDAFRQWSLNRFTEVWGSDGKIKRRRWADHWLQSPDRREFDGLEFYPDPKNAPGTSSYFNLWQGFEIEPQPKRNGYATFRDHLLNNVCNGDEGLYRWVFGFFAHIVQRPRERLGVALVFRGGMGAGKTKIGEVFGSLFPAHYFLIDNPRYLVGQFNAHMASCLLLQADEAVWAGDKHAEGRLKGLITSEVQMIEAKGIDPIRVRNFVRIVMTSNEGWVVPAGKDERRFCVLDVHPRCAQNHSYFKEMEQELRDGGREALLADLMSFDLSSVDLRQIPRTEALLEQKLHSLDSMESWWLARLRSGTALHDGEVWPTDIGVDALFKDYLTSADEVGWSRKVDRNTFGQRMFKLVPGLAKRRPRLSLDVGARRQWMYVLPALDVCREAFEAAVQQSMTWDDEVGP